MQVPENILVLIEKYQLGTITPAEKLLLDQWYQSFNDRKAEVVINEYESEQQIGDRIKERVLQTIHNEDVTPGRAPQKWLIPAAAATALLLISTGVYFMATHKTRQEVTVAKMPAPKAKRAIVPGGNKAMLTLADGSSIILDSTLDGTVGQQGNIKIQKLQNGLLAYTVNDKRITSNNETLFNTISTPRGGQYQVTLADGTKVWLNAASSIHFPVAFTGSERNVAITGEAYFEVAKNKKMPFKVKSGDQLIEVLGTHFNVSAYDDDLLIKTTLLEGSVRITKAGSGATLRPGQQAQLNKKGNIKVLKNADIEETMAWKEGLFIMKNEDIGSIMRQIARWYDVEIVYPGGLPPGRITGDIPRNMNLSKVLEVMELNGVHVTVDQRKIIVKP